MKFGKLASMFLAGALTAGSIFAGGTANVTAEEGVDVKFNTILDMVYT